MPRIRPNGPTALHRIIGERLARWAENHQYRIHISQGVALGWENGWAFGLSIPAYKIDR